MPTPTATPSARCYACGRRQKTSDPACTACGAVFRALCTCGDEHSVYATQCPGCGTALTPKRLPRSRHPAVRAARWVVLLLLVAAGVLASGVLGRAERPAWQLKDEGFHHFREGRFEEAARAFEAATKASPRDAVSWFNLAASYRALGMGGEVVETAALRARAVDPNLYQARMLLVELAIEAGKFDEAAAEARTAAELPAAPPEILARYAEIEILRRDGDLAAALQASRRAAARGVTTPANRLVAAEAVLRTYGLLPAAAYPPEAAIALAQARDAARELLEADARPDVALTRARLEMCAGSPETAYATAMEGIDRFQGTASPAVLAQLLVARARAVLAWRGYRDGAVADLKGALVADPGPATVQAMVGPLVADGHADVVEDALTSVGTDADLRGAVAFGLAQVRLSRGNPAGAKVPALRAVQIEPSDAGRQVVLGDVLRALGDVAGASDAYAAAAAAAPRWSLPVVRSCTLEIERTPAADRPAAVRRALDRLDGIRAAVHADADFARAEAEFALEAGDVRRAIEAAKLAADSAPGVAAHWTLLAVAHLADTSPGAADRAALAFQRARQLRPDDPDIAASESETLLRAADASSALAAAGRFIERHPDDLRLRRIRARAAMQVGDWRTAADDLRRLVAADPRDAAVACLAAEAFDRLGDSASARKILESFPASDDPEFRRLRMLLELRMSGADRTRIVTTLRAEGASAVAARVLFGIGEARAATETARAVLAASPGDPDATQTFVLAAFEIEPPDPALRDEAVRRIGELPSSAPAWVRPLLRTRLLLAERKWSEAYTEIQSCPALPATSVASFIRGSAALRAGHVDEGLESLRRSLSLPGSVEGQAVAVARGFLEASRIEADPRRAERHARIALELDPGSPAVAQRLSSVLLGRGDFAGAAAAAESGISAARGTPAEMAGLHLQAAFAQAAAGKPVLALAHVESAARIAPGTHAVALLRGHALLAAGDVAGAQDAYAEAKRLAPDDASARIGLVQTHVARKAFGAAAEEAEAWHRAHPADTWFAQFAASVLAEGGDRPGAVRFLRQALARRPDEVTLADALVRELGASGAAAEALEFGREFSDRRGHADARAGLVAVRAALGAPGGAAEAARRAETVRSRVDVEAPLRVECIMLEAHALLRLGRGADAETAARAALDLGVKTSTFVERMLHEAIGCAAVARGDFVAAVDPLRRCVDLAPHDALALNNLAWALAHTPRGGTDALRTARRATELRPRDANVWTTRATAAEAAEDAADAEAAWKTALSLYAASPSLDPDARARALLRFVTFLKSKGRTAEARDLAVAARGWTPAPSRTLLDQIEAALGP